MKRVCLICWLVLAVGGPTPVAMAQVPDAVVGEQKKRLIDQKIRLLETLLNSPAAKSAVVDAPGESTSLVVHAQQIIAEARQHAAEGRYDVAGKAVDDAMKLVGKATRRQTSDTSFADSAQRKTYLDLSDQVATYRRSVNDLTRDPQFADAARALLIRVDLLVADAAQLSAANRLGEANKKLADAYKLVTEDIARLRQGQQVVMSLKFDSPAEEFSYEEKRFGSNQIMVDMLIADGKADGDRRKLIDQFLAEAARLKREAEMHAQNGGHQDAVKAMERANGQLVRALQMMGVPVF
jgi:hypothetical protein